VLLLQVMQGRIQVRTRSQFKPALSTDDSNSSSKTEPSSSSRSPHGSSGGGSKAAEGSSGAAGASEADLRALFDSIDVDGSGALPVGTLTGLKAAECACTLAAHGLQGDNMPSALRRKC
jgi:hypothetical protein